MVTDIDFKFCIEFIEKFGGKAYKSPEKCTVKHEEVMNDIKTNATKAVDETSKMADVLESKFGLEKPAIPSRWLDGTNKSVRKYLWVKMKHPDYSSKETISIFVEQSIPGYPGREKPRIRFSIEMVNENASQLEYDIHHKVLDLPLKSGLCYIISSDNLKDVVALNETRDEIKEKLTRGVYKKVQISKVIDYDTRLTNENIYDEMIRGVADLLPYYDYVIGKTTPPSFSLVEDMIEENAVKGEFLMKDKIGLNTILYGPPGTGKTYNTKRYVVAICDNKSVTEVSRMDYDKEIVPRYNQLVENGRVCFTTFHQSYGYEEFIEGIKPSVNSDGNVIYDIIPGVFKSFCYKASKPIINSDNPLIDENAEVWKITIKDGSFNSVKKECFDEGYVRIGFDKSEQEGKKFIYEVNKGDIIFSLKTRKEIDAIGVVLDDQYYELDKTEYKLAKKVKWFLTNVCIDIQKYNDDKLMARMTTARVPGVKISDVLEILELNDIKIDNVVTKENKENYVFIIDEINRGNISKVFGELITLIEESKRRGNKEAIEVRLPYSGDLFTVPNNVYILGTMNTADRSISLMDTALRRRFDFVEMMPNSNAIKRVVEGIDIAKMLDVINERITILYDREHTIGHAFFTCLNESSTIKDLAKIFKHKIIPLLQEYFYEDYNKIRLVLGDTGKTEVRYEFIKEIDNSKTNIFKGKYDYDIVDNCKYEVNDEAFMEVESYKQIF